MKLLIHQYVNKTTFDYLLYQDEQSAEPFQVEKDLTLSEIFLKVNELSRQRNHFVIVIEVLRENGNIMSVQSFMHEYLLLKENE